MTEENYRRITLIDVAKLAGVSRATASLVIRNSPLVAQDTRTIVEQAIRELGYVRNLTAARLRAGQTKVIGLVIPNLNNSFFTELLSGIEEVLEQEGYAVFLANSHDDAVHQRAVAHRMREHGVDGFLVCPAVGTPAAALADYARFQVPTVQVLRHVSDQIDYVGANYFDGMEQAIKHLVSLGHEKIGFAVHGGHHSAYSERLAGFRAGLARVHLDSEILIEMPQSLTQITQSVELITSHPRSPTATICFNDLIAVGLCGGLHDLQFQVGFDHSVVGFDDVMNGEAIRPRLTSVATYPSEIGRTAAQRLLKRLGNATAPIEHSIMDVRLQVRASTGQRVK